MGTTQPLTLLVDSSISQETINRWVNAGHSVIQMDIEVAFALPHVDGIVSERAWRANNEMLKSTEGMMFKAMRAEKRVRVPKKASNKARKLRKTRRVYNEVVGATEVVS
jgi:hypothetical protein